MSPDSRPALPRPTGDPANLRRLREQALIRLHQEEARVQQEEQSLLGAPVTRRWSLQRLTLLLAGFAPGISALVHGRSAFAGSRPTPSDQPPQPQPKPPAPIYGGPPMRMPLTITGPAALADPASWTQQSVRLVPPNAKAEFVPARTVYYIPSADCAPRQMWRCEPISLGAVSDPSTKYSYLVRADKPFYLIHKSQIFAGMPGFSELILLPSFVRVPTPQGGELALFQQIAAKADDKTLNPATNRPREIRIGLASGVPFEFWTADSSGSSQIGIPSVTAIEMTGGLLKLDLLSPKGRFKGTFWIDLDAAKVVRTVIDGKEVMSTPSGTP